MRTWIEHPPGEAVLAWLDATVDTKASFRFDFGVSKRGVLRLDSMPADETGALRIVGGEPPDVLGYGENEPTLRWNEVELLARTASLRSELPHPGPIYLVLERFCPWTPDQAPHVRCAYYDRARAQAGDRSSARTQAPKPWARWVRHRGRHVLECLDERKELRPLSRRAHPRQRELWAFKHNEFPHRALARLLREAERTCTRMARKTHEVLEARDGLRWVDDLARHGTLRWAEALHVELELARWHPTLLAATAPPADPVSIAWVVELITGADIGSIAARLVPE